MPKSKRVEIVKVPIMGTAAFHLPSTYTKGMAAESTVLAEALYLGLIPEVPVVPTTIHDMTIAGMRVQVKLGENKGTTLTADIRRPSAKVGYYSAEDVDVFAIVDPISKRVAYLKFSEVEESKHRLTFFLTRDHSRKGLRKEYVVKYFDDYSDLLRIFATDVIEAA